MRYRIVLALLAVSMPAAAESQSSNSSSNCSNGRCVRVDRLVIEDERGPRGQVRVERWREGNAWRAVPRGELRLAPPGSIRRAPPRGWRDDDDDDDDDDD